MVVRERGGEGLYIRYAVPTDLPFILMGSVHNAWHHLEEEERALTHYPTLAAQTQETVLGMLQSPGTHTLVVDYHGTPIAYMTVYVGLDPTTHTQQASFVDIFVLPAFRQQGISQALHAAGMEHARRLGARRVKLIIAAANEASQRSALRAGLRVSHVVMARSLF